MSVSRLSHYQDTVLFWTLVLLFFIFSLPLLEPEPSATPSNPLKVVRFYEPREDGGLFLTSR